MKSIIALRLPRFFYNPETERTPVARTEAARALTELVAFLIPSSVSTEGIAGRHQIDAVTTDFQEALVPTTNVTHKEDFIDAISPLLIKLEQIGIGDYLEKPALRNIEKYTANDNDEIVFEGLYTPWEYDRNGAVIPSIDLSLLEKAVKALPQSTPEEQARKDKAEIYIGIVDTLLHQELAEPRETLTSRLDEPNLKDLETLQDMLDLITEGIITQVGAITEATVAKNSDNRTRMKNLSAPLVVLMKSMANNTQIMTDRDRSRYPEFWQLVDKYQRINCAIGITNSKHNTVRHEVSYIL